MGRREGRLLRRWRHRGDRVSCLTLALFLPLLFTMGSSFFQDGCGAQVPSFFFLREQSLLRATQICRAGAEEPSYSTRLVICLPEVVEGERELRCQLNTHAKQLKSSSHSERSFCLAAWLAVFFFCSLVCGCGRGGVGGRFIIERERENATVRRKQGEKQRNGGPLLPLLPLPSRWRLRSKRGTHIQPNRTLFALSGFTHNKLPCMLNT